MVKDKLFSDAGVILGPVSLAENWCKGWCSGLAPHRQGRTLSAPQSLAGGSACLGSYDLES